VQGTVIQTAGLLGRVARRTEMRLIMQTTAFAVPIPSGQMAALRELTAWMSNERNEPALRVRRQAGLDREQIFLQHTPAGDVAIIVWDTPNPARVFASFAYDESDFGLYFRHKLLEIHEGYLEALQNLPVPTVLSDWQSPGWSLERFQPAAFCFPVPAGQVSAGNRWTASLAPGGSNRDKYVDVCRTFGIERQLFSVQSMPEGEIAVMYGEGRPDWFPNAFQTDGHE